MAPKAKIILAGTIKIIDEYIARKLSHIRCTFTIDTNQVTLTLVIPSFGLTGYNEDNS